MFRDKIRSFSQYHRRRVRWNIFFFAHVLAGMRWRVGVSFTYQCRRMDYSRLVVVKNAFYTLCVRMKVLLKLFLMTLKAFFITAFHCTVAHYCSCLIYQACKRRCRLVRLGSLILVLVKSFYILHDVGLWRAIATLPSFPGVKQQNKFDCGEWTWLFLSWRGQ